VTCAGATACKHYSESTTGKPHFITPNSILSHSLGILRPVWMDRVSLLPVWDLLSPSPTMYIETNYSNEIFELFVLLGTNNLLIVQYFAASLSFLTLNPSAALTP
jgi:hypothetical protein